MVVDCVVLVVWAAIAVVDVSVDCDANNAVVAEGFEVGRDVAVLDPHFGLATSCG